MKLIKPSVKRLSRKKRSTVGKCSDNEVCMRFQKGDLPAFTELSKKYSKLLHAVAAKYATLRLPEEELVLYAKIGLLKAAHRYDENKMISFRIYAIWWMRQSVMKALREHARIEQIPEMLIQSMHEIMDSFRQGAQWSPYLSHSGISDIEISGTEKFRAARLKFRSS
ncbi:MAG TPA: sigma-70 family RNA polymerase sigma factor [Chitinophagales bacterium]|nr:sigma-70 family RNA polymerase sigma factor [Chitinophagales bacterium]